MSRTPIECQLGHVTNVGVQIFLYACLLLGLAQLWFGAFLPQLQPFGARLGGLAYVSATLLLAPVIWQLAQPGSGKAWLILAFYWGLTAALSSVTMNDPAISFSWVPVAEAGLFALASLNMAQANGLRQREAAATAARLATAATLIFFSYVHLANREVISELIPAWIPARPYWPWLTGSLLALAGPSILTRKFSDLASLVTAAMFASWILLLHVERLILRPGNMFEWNFALTALALTGVLLSQHGPRPSLKGRGSRTSGNCTHSLSNGRRSAAADPG